MYADYVTLYPTSNVSDRQSQGSLLVDSSQYMSDSNVKPVSMLKAKFKRHKMETGSGGSNRSKLKIYLNEEIVEEEANFNVLRWWKLNLKRFPTLS